MSRERQREINGDTLVSILSNQTRARARAKTAWKEMSPADRLFPRGMLEAAMREAAEEEKKSREQGKEAERQRANTEILDGGCVLVRIGPGKGSNLVVGI